MVVAIGGRRCAIPLSEVSEVLRPLPIEPLPSPLPAVLGATVVRGVTVPVIDPARLLGGDPSSVRRFVVLRLGERRAVLAVDDIHGIQDLAGLGSESLPPLLHNPESEAIQAIGRLDHELLLVLQAARLVEGPMTAWRGVSA